MKYSKKKIVSTIFLGLITFSLFFNLFTVKGLGSANDITYQFINDNLYNSTLLGSSSSFTNDTNNFNIRNKRVFTNFFNASYSFTNETDNTLNTDILYIDQITNVGSSIIRINNSINNHDKILEMYDSGANEEAIGWNYFTATQTSGSFELWFSTTDATSHSSIIIFDGANVRLHLIIINDLFQYHNGVGTQSTGVTCLDDTWYHIRIDFECSGGGYLGLGADTFFYNINGLQYGAYVFRTASVDLDRIRLGTDTSADATVYSTFYDAIGYDWLINYTIEGNLFPYSYIPNINEFEVDEWQFRHNSTTKTQYVDGFDDPSGWNDFGDAEPGIDKVNTLNLGFSALFPPKGYQRWVVVHCDEKVGGTGLYRDFNGINDTFYNLSVNFEINRLDDSDIGANAVVISVRDKDDVSFLTEVRLRTNGNVELYYDGGSSIIDTFITTGNYTVNFFLNMNSQIQHFFMYDWDDGSLLMSFIAPFYDNADDIDQILYSHVDTSAEVDTHLFSISLYNTTGSVSDDIGELDWDNVAYGLFDGFQATWYFNEYNLISIIANFTEASVFINELGGIIYFLFKDWNIISNSLSINIYNELNNLDYIFSDLKIWMFYNFSFSSLSIDGVKLTEGSNSYPLIFDYGGVDGNLSYFYVDSINRLQFTHIADDSNIEFIQAEFNINDVSSTDYAIKFRSGIDNRAYGFFRVNFTDISNFVPIEFNKHTTRFYITQGKSISSFIILITDDDDDTITGSTTGYVTGVELLFISGVTVSISTSNLLNAMIPIILIFIPTFLLASRTGKNTIIPIMMLMSIVCGITEIIPYWLLFVILIPSSLFLFLKRKEGIF